MDVYIGRCLKNWTAKHRPPVDGRKKLLIEAGYPPIQEPAPFSKFFSTFSNRWSSPGDQYYSQRHWQMVGPFTQSISWSFLLVTHQKLAN
jgi:hypothetical protein